MPHHDRFDDDTMMRSRDLGRDRDFDREGRFGRDDSSGHERGAMFGRDRHGGWGGLMGDRDRRSERDYMRHRGQDFGRDDSRRRHEQSYGPDDHSDDIPTDETSRLIASNKVEGTAVYGRDGDRLGTLHNFMVDKFSGQVRYAVLRRSSGFLGLDDRYYPLDWDELTYDTSKDGYRVRMTEDHLDDMRSFGRGEDWRGGANRRGMDRDRIDRGRDRWGAGGW